MKISVVIPVYNEAEHLEACLEALAQQNVTPFEVIVVDNNSTDQTAIIAASYNFVTLLHEPRQGVVHARRRGFDAAHGDIIARIDADSIVANGWIASIETIFQDQTLAAVSGQAKYYDVAAASVFNRLDLFFRRRLERQLSDRIYLWGANMAMRRSAWRQVRSHLCNRGGQHEDYDIAIHLQELGARVAFDERLLVSVSLRRVDSNYRDFMRYMLVSPKTYAQHGLRRQIYMYELIIFVALTYWLGRVLYRGYDPLTAHFSWTRLLTSDATFGRVDPTTNVA